MVKRLITHEHKDKADEVPRDSQLEEMSRSGESLFTRKLSDDTDGYNLPECASSRT